MSDASTSNLKKIRTFAEDVRSARGQNEAKSTTAITGTTPETGIAVASAPKSTEGTPTAVAVKSFADVPKEIEHIPSFHELQKKPIGVAVPNLTSTTAESTPPYKPTVTVRTKRNVDAPKIAVSSSNATIITDRSSNKIGFIGGIIKAFQAWWKTQKQANSKKKVPTYSVADVERRKGVVQKATSKTGSIFTADNETLREEIRRRSATVASKQAKREPEITWTPNTEAGLPLLTKTVQPLVPHNVEITFKKSALPALEIIEPKETIASLAATEDSLSTKNNVSTPDPDEIRWREATSSVPSNIIPESISPAAPSIQTPPTVAIAGSAIEQKKETVSIETPLASTPKLSLGKLIPPIRSATNRLTFGITGAIVLVGILAMGAKFLVGGLMDKNNDPAVTATYSLLPGFAISQSVLPVVTKEALIGSIQSTSTTVPTEIRLIDKKNEVLKTATTLNLIGFTGSKAFNQTVSDIRIVVKGGSRGVVVKITDPTTALGGLLNFEPVIVENLAAVLAINDTSHTNFIDKSIGKVDVRLTTNSEGAETLVYGFISRDIILITKSTADFITFLGKQ